MMIYPTQEMMSLFEERSRLHMALVNKNLLLMEGYLGCNIDELKQRGLQHDISKHHEPERTAYIWMTWMYYCKNKDTAFTYPPGVEKIVILGHQKHIHHNLHHPEAHHLPDAMSELDIVEMVADWMAISQENPHSTINCLLWAKQNIDKKWQFSLAKKQLIFTTINEMHHRSLMMQNNQCEALNG